MALSLNQSTGASVSNVSTHNLSYTSNVAVNSLLIVATNCYMQTGSTLSCADDNGHTWTELNQTSYNSNDQCAVWYTISTVAASLQVQVSKNGAANGYFTTVIAEVLDANTTTPLDGSSTNTGSGTSPNTGSDTSTVANAFWYGAYFQDETDQTQTVGSGYTLIYDNSAYTSNMPINVEYEITSATRTDNADWSVTVGATYVADLGIFAQSSGGGPTGQPITKRHEYTPGMSHTRPGRRGF